MYTSCGPYQVSRPFPVANVLKYWCRDVIFLLCSLARKWRANRASQMTIACFSEGTWYRPYFSPCLMPLWVKKDLLSKCKSKGGCSQHVRKRRGYLLVAYLLHNLSDCTDCSWKCSVPSPVKLDRELALIVGSFPTIWGQRRKDEKRRKRPKGRKGQLKSCLIIKLI